VEIQIVALTWVYKSMQSKVKTSRPSKVEKKAGAVWSGKGNTLLT